MNLLENSFEFKEVGDPTLIRRSFLCVCCHLTKYNFKINEQRLKSLDTTDQPTTDRVYF
jgi:hypothetical protein